MPPRHGKSELCSKYLPGWYLGTFPEHRVILCSYEASFAADWGRKSRTILEEWGNPVFGINVAATPAAADHWDIQGHAGGMQTAGVGGPITGKGAHLLIVDDPVKNKEEADSELMRRKTWDWWTSTAYTRLEPGAAAIVIQTRWHEDDLTGKLLEDQKQGGDKWRVVKFPAIDENNNPLWAERYPLSELLKIKRAVGSYVWSALYQQTPTPDEGGKFKRAWFQVVASVPAHARRAVRYWDWASTEADGDYTVGVLLVECDGVFYVADVQRGQWGDLERTRMIRQTAELDSHRYMELATYMESAGAGGKDVVKATIRACAGQNIRADVITGKSGGKELRAGPVAAACENGDVRLVHAAWNKDFVDECAIFPNGANDDQVDAFSGAFNKITGGRGKIIIA